MNEDWPWLADWKCFSCQGDFSLEATLQTERGAVASQLNWLAQQAAVTAVCRFEYSDEALSALEYEERVSKGAVPTRDCLHDWYNGLVWLRFPKAKALINRLHISDSIEFGSGNGRSSRRNALTLLDEAGGILVSEAVGPIVALKQFDWQALLVEGRRNWPSVCRLTLFGHGLLESLHRPYKGLCAKVVCFQVESLASISDSTIDDLLVNALSNLESAKDLTPLPVMGVPGWFAVNQSLGFYEDKEVFREKPTHRL